MYVNNMDLICIYMFFVSQMQKICLNNNTLSGEKHTSMILVHNYISAKLFFIFFVK